MACNALLCSASPLVLKTSTLSSSSQIGFGPRSIVSFRRPTSTKTPSLVVKAQAEEDGSSASSKDLSNVPSVRNEPRQIENIPLPLHLNKGVVMVDTSLHLRTAWNTIEDENGIRMWFDVPGVKPQEINVDVVDNLLLIKGKEGIYTKDALGGIIRRPFECKLQLPFNCDKVHTNAVLKNVLYISIPKITKAEFIDFIHVPVKSELYE